MKKVKEGIKWLMRIRYNIRLNKSIDKKGRGRIIKICKSRF